MDNIPKILYFGLPRGSYPSNDYAKWFFEVHKELIADGSVRAYFLDHNPMVLDQYIAKSATFSIPYLLMITARARKFLREINILHILNQSPRFSGIIPSVSLFKPRSDFKIVLTVHDILRADGSIDFSFQRTLENIDCIFVPSEYTKMSVQKELECDININVTYNPINLKKYQPLPSSDRLALKSRLLSNESRRSDSIILLFVGSGLPRKNISGLIELLSILIANDRRFQLVIVSHPSPLRNEYRTLATKLGVEQNLIWFDHIDEDKMPGLYNLSDIFITLSKGEGFCVPVVEAMACGRHVIASNSTSLPEIVADGGDIVNPDDLDSIARHILKVIDNKKFEDPVDKAVNRAKKFSPEAIASRYLNFYLELLGNETTYD